MLFLEHLFIHLSHFLLNKFLSDNINVFMVHTLPGAPLKGSAQKNLLIYACTVRDLKLATKVTASKQK